jgi:prolyl-tRNA synthetase
MRLSALLLLIALTACTKEQVDAQTGAIGKAKTAAAQASARVNTSQENEIGVEECDTYLRNMESCLAEKVPEAQREGLRVTLNAERIRWQDQATSGTDREKIASDCKASTDSAKRTLATYGCTF